MVPVDKRIYVKCEGEFDDEVHFLTVCKKYISIREDMPEKVCISNALVTEWSPSWHRPFYSGDNGISIRNSSRNTWNHQPSEKRQARSCHLHGPRVRQCNVLDFVFIDYHDTGSSCSKLRLVYSLPSYTLRHMPLTPLYYGSKSEYYNTPSLQASITTMTTLHPSSSLELKAT